MDAPVNASETARERLADKLAERTIDRNHNSIETINLCLLGEALATRPPAMADVIWRWLTTLDHAIPTALRNDAIWKLALASGAYTGTGPADAQLAPALTAAWSVVASLESVAAGHGVKTPWNSLLELRSVQSARSLLGALNATPAPTPATAALRYVAADVLGFLDELPKVPKDPAAARRAADYAAMTLIDACPPGKGSKAYWQRIDPPAVLRAMAHATAKTA